MSFRSPKPSALLCQNCYDFEMDRGNIVRVHLFSFYKIFISEKICRAIFLYNITKSKVSKLIITILREVSETKMLKVLTQVLKCPSDKADVQ
jgi:hypothetical protein